MATVTIDDAYLYDIGNAIRFKNGLSTKYYTSEMASAIRSISYFSEPVGTYEASKNGLFDVKTYASAVVSIPITEYVSGFTEIKDNGTYNVETYKDVVVNVFTNSNTQGTLSISDNGTYDIASIRTIEVSIPRPSIDEFVSGTFSITENGEYNITSYASITVSVPDGVQLRSDRLVITSNSATYDVTEYREVSVEVPEGIYQSAIYKILENGTYEISGIDTIVVETSNGGWLPGEIDEITKSILDGTVSDITMADVTTIRELAFVECSMLTDVLMPNVSNVGKMAFLNCSSLETVNLQSATVIEQYAFQGCTALSKVTLGDVTRIGAAAFDGCTSLREIKMTSCTSVPILENSNVFNGVPSDFTVYVPQSLKYQIMYNWLLHDENLIGVEEVW